MCMHAYLFTSPWPPPPQTKKYSPFGHAAPYSAMPYFASLSRVPTGDLPMDAVDTTFYVKMKAQNVCRCGGLLVILQQLLLHGRCTDFAFNIAGMATALPGVLDALGSCGKQWWCAGFLVGMCSSAVGVLASAWQDNSMKCSVVQQFK